MKEDGLKIGMCGIHVDDPVKAFKFYTEVLGFVEVMFDAKNQIALIASKLDPKGTTLLLEPTDNEIAKPYRTKIYEKGLPVIIFSCKDLQKEYERLKEAGVKFKTPPTDTEWGKIAIFDDTCGNYVQLFEEK